MAIVYCNDMLIGILLLIFKIFCNVGGSDKYENMIEAGHLGAISGV